ncbi:carbonic anhydrase 1-like isoform X1 [Dermacentor albipictus]|uniref:carbonic anhydrase 1-like isoform X1 n=2 Tax=Dermacentor albipictus TaxID=60249 RepID=UPI0038FD1A0E
MLAMAVTCLCGLIILFLFSVFLLFYLPVIGQPCWNYDNDQSWSWPEFQCIEHNSCGGVQQSPVNIETLSVVHDVGMKPLEFYAHDVPLRNFTVHNDGLSLALRPSPADKTKRTVRGGLLQGTFEFTHALFHWGSTSSQGSEHRLDGIAYPMEAQLVYTNEKYASVDEPDQTDRIAIISTLYQLTFVNFDSVRAMGGVLDALESEAPTRRRRRTLRRLLRRLLPWMVRRLAGSGSGSAKGAPFPLTLNSLMPPADLQEFYTYRGSLTTPPCTESVRWTVFRKNAFVSEALLQRLRRLRGYTKSRFLSDNFRPPQRLHGRKIISSFRPF